MRRAASPRSRGAVLIVPPASDGWLAGLWRKLVRELCRPYSPERHYMRGPGPKWHAKHDPAPLSFDAVPALVRVRVKR